MCAFLFNPLKWHPQTISYKHSSTMNILCIPSRSFSRTYWITTVRRTAHFKWAGKLLSPGDKEEGIITFLLGFRWTNSETRRRRIECLQATTRYLNCGPDGKYSRRSLVRDLISIARILSVSSWDSQPKKGQNMSIFHLTLMTSIPD